MKTAFAALLSTILVGASLAQLTINTPANAVVCQPLLITWSGGTPPYFLSALPGANPTGAAVVDFGEQSGTSLTWKVNVDQGTSLGFTLRDSSGTTAQTAPFTVNPGADRSCVGQNPSGSSAAGGATGGAAGGSASGTGTGAATTGTATTTTTNTAATTTATVPAGGATTGTTGTSKPSGSSAGAATSAKPATSSNAASANAISLGVVGAAVLAMLA